MKIGAWIRPDGGVDFTVWAPHRHRVDLQIESPSSRTLPMERDARGYWHASIPHGDPSFLYRYRLDGETSRPDPASQYQPRGVHEPSAVVDHRAFKWTDGKWKGIDLEAAVFYELHVGTFTEEGTFEAVIPRLAALKELGVTVVEIMPVAQFPGERNWGYDGVYPYAVQSSYGGPQGLKRLVDACHAHGLGLALDVVYNHLGPEGNYLREFGPYFTDRYRTAWGQAINFDGPGSDDVRNYFIENALFWLREYHVDALRVDAVHAVFDMSATPFLEELPAACHEFARSSGRRILVVAESNLNDARIVRSREEHGYGFDAFWSDDLHHAIHTLLTGESDGYYMDFGSPAQLAQCLRDGLIYSGQYSRFLGRRHGNSAAELHPRQFVVSSQTHDQVGNRMQGDRLCRLVSFEASKSAAALVLLSPFVPLLFMGEEYAEPAPFPFFASHTDPGLIDAVRKGRREEFAAFAWLGDPPDPFSPQTFQSAKLRWDLRKDGQHRRMLEFYQELLRLRRDHPALRAMGRESYSVETGDDPGLIVLSRWTDSSRLVVGLNARRYAHTVSLPGGKGTWKKILDSEDATWGNGDLAAPPTMASGQDLTVHPYQTVAYEKE